MGGVQTAGTCLGGTLLKYCNKLCCLSALVDKARGSNDAFGEDVSLQSPAVVQDVGDLRSETGRNSK